MQRHVFSHAIVNMGFNITLKPDAKTIDHARVVLGGATADIILASRTAAAISGRTLTPTLIHIPVFYCIICKCHQPSPSPSP